MLLISDIGNIRLRVEANNRIATAPGLPPRYVITASHVRPWASYSWNDDNGGPAPTLDSLAAVRHWRLEGKKRPYTLISVIEVFRKARKEHQGYNVTPFLFTFDDSVDSPEEEAAQVSPVVVKTHLRKFDNLILEDE